MQSNDDTTRFLEEETLTRCIGADSVKVLTKIMFALSCDTRSSDLPETKNTNDN